MVKVVSVSRLASYVFLVFSSMKIVSSSMKIPTADLVTDLGPSQVCLGLAEPSSAEAEGGRGAPSMVRSGRTVFDRSCYYTFPNG